MSYINTFTATKPAGVEWFATAFPEVSAQYFALLADYAVYSQEILNENQVRVTRTFPSFARYQEFVVAREDWPSYHQILQYNLSHNIVIPPDSLTFTGS